MSPHVLVIGGGPGGSTTATLLAREGIQVTLVERETFPRYHIGESLLPSCLEVLDLLGVREKIEKHGFQRKPGGIIKWFKEDWNIEFGELAGKHTYSYQVVRSEFDRLLLEHSKEAGAHVLEGVEVNELTFDGDQPRAAKVTSRADGKSWHIPFDYVVDASGRAGIMATKYLKNRRFHESFQNLAVWGYWKGIKNPEPDKPGYILLGSNADGWLWGIPLHDGTMSVGIVMHKSAYKARQPCTSREAYLASIAECKLFQGMIAEAELVSDVKIETDYSYVSDRFAGPGYFMVGDAACFIDPLLSSGVHLAMLAAMIASASIISATLGDVTAVEGRNFFEKCYRNAYLRFMVFVSVFYQKSGVQEQCFREAQKLTAADVHGADLKQAFLHLVSGLEDMQDAGDVFHRTILEEVGKNLEENVDLRMDKTRLHDAQRNETARVQNNARFFDAIEGLFSISREVPVDGLYVSTSPRLQLARV